MKLFRLVTALVLAGATLFISTPASAHDDVVKTFPAAGATIDAGKTTLSVTFAEEILDINDGKFLVIQVMTPMGKNASNNCLTVDGNTLSVDLDLDEAGKYIVAWQSVSTDGHSNTGTFNFSVKNSGNYKATGVPTCEPKQEDNKTAAPQTSEKSDSNSANSNQGQILAFFFVLFGLAAAIGASYFVRRKKLSQTAEGDDSKKS